MPEYILTLHVCYFAVVMTVDLEVLECRGCGVHLVSCNMPGTSVLKEYFFLLRSIGINFLLG